MGLVLGVEGDGAHTHAVLTDSSGVPLGFGANDDSSDWDSVGIAAAAAALRSCITEALSSAQAEGTPSGQRSSGWRAWTSPSTSGGSAGSRRRSG